MKESFEIMLTGGHPNSLGRTVEVVEMVLASPDRFEELFGCYKSDDPVVRLRTSSALKRVEDSHHGLLVPYIDRLIDEIGPLDQASAQWTLAQLFDRLDTDMDEDQRKRALGLLKNNLKNHDDWIVLNATMETLGKWSEKEARLGTWLKPHLERLAGDKRKSVASRAKKISDRLYG